MSAVLKRKYTAAEYLELERAAEYRSEFYRGEIIAMAGASIAHNRVKENLVVEVGSRLKKSSCQSFSSDMKVYVDRTGNYFYPDILVVCGKPQLHDDRSDVVENPTLIIEVLSPSTENFDRGMKFLNYQRVPSLKEYLLVSQDQPLVIRYVRQDDEGWIFHRFEGLEAILEFKSIPISIPLADIYDRVEFQE